MGVYDKPFYYEIAFSFVDPEKQVDVFEEIIDRYSEVEVNRVLDLACGPSLQLREMAKRDYEAVGLDLSPEMLGYLEEKAEEEGIDVETVEADMTDFELEEKVDFAFMMMGSFQFESNQKVLDHLDCVSSCLREGGLYVIENLRLDWRNFESQSWVVERDGIRIEATWNPELKDPVSQICKETLTLEVDDNGEKLEFEEETTFKILFPQEFLTLLKLNGNFEFLGWFKRFDFEGLDRAKNDNLAVLRKK